MLKTEKKDYTVREFSEIVRLHKQTIYRLAEEGKIPGAYRVGGRWRIARNATDQLKFMARGATSDD